MKRLIAVALFAVLSACASGTNTMGAVIDRPAAQRAVFAAWEGYAVSERLATTYAQLRRCGAPAVPPCSQQSVVDQTVKARNVARDALNAAQATVDNPLFGHDVLSTAVAAGQAGAQAFQSIAASLK